MSSKKNVYTLGQFKDDQVQEFHGDFIVASTAPSTPFASGVFVTRSITGTSFGPSSGIQGTDVIWNFNNAREARAGLTTHGKQLGVNYIIKY